MSGLPGDFTVVVPHGWQVQRRGERHWYVFHGQRWVSELGVLSTGEWWVCPDGEVLPWGRTFGSAAEAVDAVARWWHRSGGGRP